MTDEQALLAAIVENSEDDLPRLIYADFIQEQGQSERAEFIRLQCQIAKLKENDPNREKLENREKKLLQKNRKNWQLVIDCALPSYEFKRGFIERITIEAGLFPLLIESIYQQTPLQFVALLWDYDHAKAIAECPWLNRLQGIRLSNNGVNDDELRILLQSPYWPELKTFELFGSSSGPEGMRHLSECSKMKSVSDLQIGFTAIGVEGFQFLARSKNFSNLQQLALRRCEFNQPVLESLSEADWLTQLTSFTLMGDQHTDEDLIGLFAQKKLKHLKTFDLSYNPRIGLPGFAALSSNEDFAGLENLSLRSTHLYGDRLQALLTSPILKRLRWLILRDTRIRDFDIQSLANSSILETVEILDLGENFFRDESARAIAESPYLKNLQRLDFPGKWLTKEGKQILKDRLGKKVVIGK